MKAFCEECNSFLVFLLSLFPYFPILLLKSIT